ncbi:FAD-binding protein [Streptomyces sp. NPDC047108]|uniref:FAD-binding protein n=1 Tax=Streptomyces sp. NPDC047108 TaxID=3155025 RepID=UPI00340A609C
MIGPIGPRYDTVVCGTGAAGRATARALSELGLHVLVVDKQYAPSHRPDTPGVPG